MGFNAKGLENPGPIGRWTYPDDTKPLAVTALIDAARMPTLP